MNRRQAREQTAVLFRVGLCCASMFLCGGARWTCCGCRRKSWGGRLALSSGFLTLDGKTAEGCPIPMIFDTGCEQTNLHTNPLVLLACSVNTHSHSHQQIPFVYICACVSGVDGAQGSSPRPCLPQIFKARQVVFRDRTLDRRPKWPDTHVFSHKINVFFKNSSYLVILELTVRTTALSRLPRACSILRAESGRRLH